MFTEKERNQLNRFLSNQTFTCSAAIMDTGPEHKYEFEYRFKIVGEKKMMSVGEYYMYNVVDVEIIGIDEKYKTAGPSGNELLKNEWQDFLSRLDVTLRD